jgi:hypothetical protein
MPGAAAERRATRAQNLLACLHEAGDAVVGAALGVPLARAVAKDGKGEVAHDADAATLVAREKRRTPGNALASWDLQVSAFARSLSATGENLAKPQPG